MLRESKTKTATFYNIVGFYGLTSNASAMERKAQIQKIKASLSNVSVNFNWVHPPPPPGNARENFFERANPGHPGKFFCLIPCPGAKNDGQIPREWGKIFPNSKKLPLKLAENPQEIQKLRDSTSFLFGELNKTFIF